MSNIGMVEANLPPGFRFHPKDEELIFDYLMKKVDHCDSLLMVEVDLNQCEPWDLPEAARVGSREWYFYSQRDRKYATGLRTNRATASGYWKATGKDKPVLRKGTLVGMRKTLVFYQGRAPKGRKTDWVMHEFRLEGPFAHVNQISSLKEDWVICRVLYKSRESPAKPSMGSCYGNTSSSSLSLPPLMDSYISFDQTQANLLDDQYEQVPCFSLVSECQPNSIISHNIPIGPNIPTKSFTRTSYGNLPLSMGTKIPHCENKAVRGLSDYLIKQENNTNVKRSRSFGEGSSESYLSEVGNISSLWN